MNVTYSDLFQLLIFIVALVSLCYQIFRDKRKFSIFNIAYLAVGYKTMISAD